MTKKRITCLCLALLLVPALAAAQPKTAADWFKDGETQYNLGNFSVAIDHFKKAFELETNDANKAIYLYNIAQSYRFAKDCSNAQFFYKRFLAMRETQSPPLDAKKRSEIEARIKDLEECARQVEVIKNKPPDGSLDPNKTNPTDGNNGTKTDPKNNTPKGPDVADNRKNPDDPDPDDPDKVDVRKPAEEPPRVVSVRLAGGGAKISAGGLDVPVQATGALIGGYPIAIDKLVLELGAGFSFTPVPFEGQMMVSKTAQLIGLVGNVSATYTVIPRLGVRGDVGAGVLWFNGVGQSPFTNFAPTSGALPMFHVRLGISADYAITPNIIATIVPIVFSYSPPAAGLRNDIDSIRAIDFMVGLGYRM